MSAILNALNQILEAQNQQIAELKTIVAEQRKVIASLEIESGAARRPDGTIRPRIWDRDEPERALSARNHV